jgi:hypothetical protein
MDLININMETYRGISIVIGVLYLLVFIAGFLSIAHAVDDSEYLTKSALNSNQIYMAAFFQFIMAILYIGIAILLYPILKVYNERIAVGFLSSRIIAVIFVLIGTITLLLILRLSQEFVRVNSSSLLNYNVIGDLLQTARDLVNHVGMIIVLCIGGIMLYILMIQSGLIPSWLSVWGILGSVISILASILVLIKYLQILSPTYLILNIPIALQEIVFAVWLILKGFKQV